MTDLIRQIVFITYMGYIAARTVDKDNSWIHHGWSKQADGRDLEIMDFDEWARRN